MNKLFGTLLITACVLQADIIKLNNGKTVEGEIVGYNSGDGISVITDTGDLTIKINQVESFKITESSTAQEAVTYDNSRLKKLGFNVDFNTISGMDFLFDSPVGSIGEVLLYGLDNTLGIGLLISEEPMDMTNEEYFKTLDALQKANFSEYTDTPRRTNKVGPFSVLQKTYDAKVQNMDFTYKLITFKVGTSNYRVLYWALVPVFERADAKIIKFLSAFKVSKK